MKKIYKKLHKNETGYLILDNYISNEEYDCQGLSVPDEILQVYIVELLTKILKEVKK